MGKTTEVQAAPYELDIKNWVTKSNQLIEATYKLSLQEQRILLVLASKVQPSDEELKAYKFRVQDFMDIVGTKPGTGYYSHIRQVVSDLQTKTLTIKQGTKTMVANWLITAIYEDNEGSILLKFNPDLKHLFLNLKEKFTSYQLENVIKLQSIYSIRIYELLKQYLSIGKRHFTIEELRTYLAIEEGKYKQYGHFKSKVLNVAMEELKVKTDLSFTFEEHKTGRKVTSITFYIKDRRKEKGNLLNAEVNAEEEVPAGEEPSGIEWPEELQEISLSMLDLGIEKEKTKYLLNTYPKEQLERNIEYVKLQQQKKNIDNLGGYLFNAIKMDYAKAKKSSVRTSRFVSDHEKYEQQDMFAQSNLNEKDTLYIKEYGDTAKFEAHCLSVKGLKERLAKLSKNETNIVYESIVELVEQDIQRLQDSDQGFRDTSEFQDNFIKNTYEDVLQRHTSNEKTTTL
ncbi:replication initiation protein [Bacillus sp. RO1]|uniref:replication initiation protein n=1 Tax=Bacillus sp. RO1 TaxID=2722703 RepID=UPI001456E049|nr:replication initiation protein [Bacillus sp. RO1]NLP52046.1 replication initiation protein [Bacillus sp. RO1]